MCFLLSHRIYLFIVEMNISKVIATLNCSNKKLLRFQVSMFLIIYLYFYLSYLDLVE